MWYQHLFLFNFVVIVELVTVNHYHQRRHMSSSFIKLDFNINAVYNKLYERQLNLNSTEINRIEPKTKVWFAITNDSIYALPMFGDYPGPFHIQFLSSKSIELNLKFHFTPSKSLFSPSNHLLLAIFNISSVNFQRSTINRYYLIQTLAFALNLSKNFLTIHKINGTMIKVYFSCDFYSTNNLTYQINSLIDYYYLNRLELIKHFPLPLIEITIVRLSKSISSSIQLKTAAITIRTRLANNHTMISSPTIHLQQFYQPLVLVPLAIIVIGLLICTIIAICLCCNRQSSSTSTLLLPMNSQGTPTNKHLYQNYKYRQQQEYYKKKHYLQDQRQFISKGIPVVFAEELEEKLEQTHTPLVMRIEKVPL